MIILNNINLPLDTDFSELKSIAARQLKTDIGNILSCSLYRKSVDARHKNNIVFCCSLLVEVKYGEEKLLKKCRNAIFFKGQEYVWGRPCMAPDKRPVIVGFGPAGMFSALLLARSGLKPIVVERGCDADTRKRDVEAFWNGGKLNTESNVQFGEGGAGTFSDGKLNTGIKDIRCRTVLKTFAEFGAGENILIDSKPHIGTDVLINVVKNIREEIIRCGGEVRFSSKLDGIFTDNGRLNAISVNGESIECNTLVLATGHSARDTFEMLLSSGAEMMRKPFAMGVRIEHLQSDINKSLYGDFANHPALKAADYKLAVHLESGRGVFTFCMCPGGEVVNASSEKCGIAVNGMSQSSRSGKNANSAVLVSVEPDDINGSDVLAGCELQRKIEKKAYELAGGKVPVTTVGRFIFGDDTSATGKITPTVKPYKFADISGLFPEFIENSLKAGIKLFDSKICGFADCEAIISAPETRSSSPVRIVRGEDMQSVSIKGIYPCGEGAGYAGGIMSAATDGLKVAEKIISCLGFE